MTGRGSRVRLAAAWVGVAASAAGVAAGITAVYRGMRNLMVESGGVCASGGPYEIANQCSDGQVALLFGGVIGALVAGALHAAFTSWVDGPRIGAFGMMGAGFAALGWNFIELGLDPPDGSGTVAGWLFSGVLFWLMAAGFAAPALIRAVEWLRRGGAPEPPAFSPEVMRSVFGDRS